MGAFHYIHLRAFAHETEDPERVREAIRRVVGDPKLALDETAVDGSHKNRIRILEAEVRSAPAAKRLFRALAHDDPEGFARLVEEHARRVDENLNFFLRLDKQEAYGGRVVLGRNDDAITLRAKIKSFESRRSGAGAEAGLETLRTFLQGVGTAA